MPKRNYLFYGLTNSICSQCLNKVEAKIIFRDHCVYLIKNCLIHGREEVLIADDIEYYKKTWEFIKPGDMPLKFQTPTKYGCPYDCGLCPDHEQHSCLTLIEVSDRCNLSCPICYADSGVTSSLPTQRHKSLAEIEKMLDVVVASEGEPQIVQLSGGEPTIHPEFFAIMDLAKSKPIKHLMINTNGVKIATDKEFCRRLSEYKPGIEIYLQFDSFNSVALQQLRGMDLRSIREEAMANLNEFNISTTLVVTLKKGLNDSEIGQIIEYAKEQKSVRGVTFQPIQAAGRLEGFNSKKDRYTLTEVRRAILEQSSYFKPEDILPVPCHPDALAMAYGLKINGKLIPLTSLISPSEFVQIAPNSVLYEQDEVLKNKFFDLFSTSHSPNSSAISLKQLLCCLPLALVPDSISYENVFRIMIVSFLDPYNFDVRSVKRSCIHIVHSDGRIIPFDTFNIFYRPGSVGHHLVTNRAGT